MHVAAEELVVALEALHEALGRQDARLALLRLDLRTQQHSHIAIGHSTGHGTASLLDHYRLPRCTHALQESMRVC